MSPRSRQATGTSCREPRADGDPHTAVEVEARRPGLLRQRLDEAIEGLVDSAEPCGVQASRSARRSRA
ncbi:hypothetical protein, partial [Streptomyces sp.]|uniref:hypothetical protein n=1 Tax=Streptomyces sp. TaxID=1931 RepID=UPI002F401884